MYELLAEIPVGPSNLSQQLAVLRKTQLVTVRREAGQVIYSVSAPEVRELLRVARRILIELINVDVETGTPGPQPEPATVTASRA